LRWCCAAWARARSSWPASPPAAWCLSTLRQAADLDYGLIVLADACLDADPEVHRVLTEKVFPRQAEVSTVAQWAERQASP
jgi:nicotinamidase-related amidase